MKKIEMSFGPLGPAVYLQFPEGALELRGGSNIYSDSDLLGCEWIMEEPLIPEHILGDHACPPEVLRGDCIEGLHLSYHPTCAAAIFPHLKLVLGWNSQKEQNLFLGLSFFPVHQ